MSADNVSSASRPPILRGALSPWYLPTFDRWFGLAFVRMLIYSCLVILSLIVLIDNLENFDEFIEFAKDRHKTNWEMFWILCGHYSAYAPSLLCQHMIVIIPIASAVIVTTQSCMNREFTLLRSAGISLQRAIMPLLTLALVFGLVYFAARDSFVPLILRKSFIMNNQLRPAKILPLNEVLRFGNTQQHLIMGHYEAHEGAAYNLSIEVRDLDDYAANKNNFTLYQARRAFLQDYINVDNPNAEFDKQWMPDTTGPAVVKVYRNHRYTSTPWTEAVPTTIRAARLERQILTDMVMTWSDLLRSRDDLDIRLEISRRLAEPLMAVAILLVILPLVLRGAARGIPASYITNAIICVVVYGVFFLLNSMLFSLGVKNVLSPLLASQLANIIFIGVGIWLLRHIES